MPKPVLTLTKTQETSRTVTYEEEDRFSHEWKARLQVRKRIGWRHPPQKLLVFLDSIDVQKALLRSEQEDQPKQEGGAR